VTLFGAGENRTSATFIQTYAEPQYARLGQSLPECAHSAAASRTLARLDVDVVHDHTCAGLLAASARLVPTLATMHGPMTPEVRRYVRDCAALTRGRGSLSLVAISDDQRRRGVNLPWLGRVYNAVRVRDFPFRARKEDFVLFLGRSSPEKGMDVAIDVARRAGRHLMLAAKCNEPAEHAYFEEKIRPRLGPHVTWLGEVGGQQKLDLLMRARCLLFPIQWDEPFGMVLIEALACGTPVVALRRGSIPELIEEGVTGLVTSDPGRLSELVNQVEHISPTSCRRVALEKFDIDQMARGYEQLYLRLAPPRPGRRSSLVREDLTAPAQDVPRARLTPDPRP
jgi:glycosyltransferase involved in cell wall biosynthesis